MTDWGGLATEGSAVAAGTAATQWEELAVDDAVPRASFHSASVWEELADDAAVVSTANASQWEELAACETRVFQHRMPMESAFFRKLVPMSPAEDALD